MSHQSDDWRKNDLAIFTGLALGIWTILALVLLADKDTGWNYLQGQPYHPSLYYLTLRILLYLFLAINLTSIFWSIRRYNPLAGRVLLAANLLAALVLNYWLPRPYPIFLIVWLCGVCLLVFWLESRSKKKIKSCFHC